MQKLILTLLLFLSCSVFSQSNNSHLPEAVSVHGQVYLVNIKTNEKKALKVGDKIPQGFAIVTEANSEAILLFQDQIKKIIPAKSRFQVMNSKQWEQYKKTNQSANKIFTLVGRKAANQESELKKREQLLKQSFTAFTQKNYLKTIEIIEKNKLSLDHPNDVYMGAVSYLNLGLEEKSLKLFTKLIEYDTFEFRDFSRFGAFLCNLRLGNTEQAKKIQQNYQKQNKISNEMDDLLKSLD